MDVFEIHGQMIDEYRSYTSSFVDPRDERIKEFVESRYSEGAQWPSPWLSLNPNYESGGSITSLVDAGLLHPECRKIFRIKPDATSILGRELTLHRHQSDAIRVARSGKSYVLTTGTGSGKSLSYIIPIVDAVLRDRDAAGGARQPGVKAIIVYPMNALANSQIGELTKFLRHGYPADGEPVTFARYTGQEKDDERRAILANPPDILLTNYVMLELVLTRPDERKHLIRAARGLRFLALDELHTYRGRQGADVSMLVRRVRDACQSPDLQVIGTSATMASAGTVAEQQSVVADVATRIFGAEVLPDRVIGETLERATASRQLTADSLAMSVASALREELPSDYANLLQDPLACWIEEVFGLDTEETTGRLIRRKPTTVPAAAVDLARFIAGDPADCERAIQSALLHGSRVLNPETGRPLFAFRLHQFLSKGDTVFATIEHESSRHLTDAYQLRAPGAPEKVLLPLGFCRECGQEYYVVSRVQREGQMYFVPRQDGDASGGDAVTGYLYTSSDYPWPSDPVLEGRLPDTWLAVDDDGEIAVLPNKRKYLPVEVWIGPDGQIGSTSPARQQGWFVSTPFAFCMRCRVSYEQVRGNDYGKLATLDREGRSSAVTVVSAAIVRALHGAGAEDLPAEARKLLTFVDNRQDASLQAGHFNDFALVTQIRGAVYRAVSSAGELTHESIGKKVTEALAVPMTEFAQNPDALYNAKTQAESALRAVVEYRLYSDLERGWRVTMPNLEQTGLLNIDYSDLATIAADQALWQSSHAALAALPAEKLEEVLRLLLDELRRSMCIDAHVLTDEGFEELRRVSQQHLRGPWALGDTEQIRPVRTLFPTKSVPGRSRNFVFMSGRSAFGQYLRNQKKGLGRQVTVDDAGNIISAMLEVLHRCGLLAIVDPLDGVPGYRLKAAAITWYPGSGETGVEDPLRRNFDSETVPRANPFFIRLYRELAADLRGLEAREHTAQVPSAIREEREMLFRAGTLPLLYCSPTMELGVDIASLNAVALRNVPPTPANYAQRSGRAGRSGQPALVVTYCATGNSHDSYYFRNSREMVAGSVIAPRLDLANEDLLRSHIHAIWLAETDQSLHSRITDTLDATGDQPALNIYPDVWERLIDPSAQNRAIVRAQHVMLAIREMWTDQGDLAPWWTDDWVERQVGSAPENLDRAFDRWRDLYRAAKAEYDEQTRLAIDPKAPTAQKKIAKRRADEARTQLNLLQNEQEEVGQSDFYSYRYLASEGFLPGYSFPRLPLAAYVPGQRGGRLESGEYIQRPRFLAISEFGPGSLIYHEGSRYEVDRIQLPRTQPGDTGAVQTEDARRCEACGYHHPVGVGIDTCVACGEQLGAKTTGLLRLQTVFTKRRERISSDEEERRKSGFELETSYRFHDHGDRPGSISAVTAVEGSEVLSLQYGDSATVRVSNVGRRRRKEPSDRGFWLDLQQGKWLTEKKASDAVVDSDGLDEAEDVKKKQKVIPYVEDRRNILVMRLAESVEAPVAVTFRYAMERAIEALYQLEDSELATEMLPDLDSRGRALFTESSEGGAGVLRRIVLEPGAMADLAKRALELLHFDPDTGSDLGNAAGARERCEHACYDCLLSYGNQLDHAVLDRMRVRDLLMLLRQCTTSTGAGGRNRTEQLATLEPLLDSQLERDFLAWLNANGRRLPDRAQVTVDEARARPDFVYDLPVGPVAIFIDGPVHNSERQAARDNEARSRLEDVGWLVISIRYDEDWHGVTAGYPSVFGE